MLNRCWLDSIMDAPDFMTHKINKSEEQFEIKFPSGNLKTPT